MRLSPLAALAFVLACNRDAPLDMSSGSSGGCEPGTANCSCADEGCFGDWVCSGGVCVEPNRTSSDSSTGGEGSSTSGGSSGDASSSGTSTSGTSTTEPAGSTSSTGSAGTGDASSTGAAAVCGDGVLAGDEACDDGNTEPGDGCDEACAVERWSHVGVAHDVPVGDLHLWEPCWSSTYEPGAPVDDVQANCTGDHILLACRPVGADILTLAAHGPRDAVFKSVKYDTLERSTANGVDFFWAPYYAVIGFGPEGDAFCYGEGSGDADTLCWRADLEKFLSGFRCGDVANMSVAQTKAWERVIFQAWE